MASEAGNISPIFQLRAVELHELTVTKPTSVAAPPTSFNFEIGIETNVDNQQKLIINATKVTIKDKEQDNVLGSIICACVFSVANFEEMITMNGGRAEINETFAETLNAISISTTRGIMFSELKGTFLHYAFLPIIDVKKLAKASV